jgi:DegV family protein with EDD domain
MTVRVIVDSLGDLPAEVIKKLDITVIPLHVLFGTESFRDGVDMNTEQFYARLVSSKSSPTTSVPNLGTFIDIYEKLAKTADEILVIAVSHKLSATFETASKAAEMVKIKTKIKVIDSMSVIMGEGLLAIQAAEMAKKGAGLDEIINKVRSNILRTESRMAFDTLEYLRRGGRIGAGQAFLGSLLKINPVLALKDGEVYPLSRERSRIKAIEALYNWVLSYRKIDTLAIEDATTPDEANQLVERLKAKFPGVPIYRSKVGAVIGTHTGPSVIAVSVVGDK